MPDETPARPPAPVNRGPPLERSALERVLARATELQALGADTPDGLTEEQLMELGREVGIPSEHLRQALAEERTRVAVPKDQGVVGSWFGSTVATAQRVVRGTPEQVLAQLDRWMQHAELLRQRRRYADRLTWEARQDFFGNVQALFKFGGRSYALTGAVEIGATAIAVDAERTLVRLDADFTPSRRRSVAWSAVLAGGGVASGAGIVGLASMMPSGSVLLGAAIGSVWTALGGVAAAGVATSQRKRLERGQLALEQILDRLEHGEMKSPRGSLLEFFTSPR
jgi:hypothetical protein